MIILPKISGLQHIGLPTGAIEKTLDFYKAFGFEEIYSTYNGTQRVVFLQLSSLCLEVYELGNAPEQNGAIDHLALEVDDIETAYRAAMQLNLNIIEDGIRYLPFWDKGIRFFTVTGPSRERLEFVQKL